MWRTIWKQGDFSKADQLLPGKKIYRGDFYRNELIAMNIAEHYHDLETVQTDAVLVLDEDGQWQSQSLPVIREHLLEVYVNEILTMKLTCTPTHLAELVLGRLLSEGIVRDSGDVEALYICEQGLRARVFLKQTAEQPPASGFVARTPTCCTGNRILNDYFVSAGALSPLVPIPWKTEWIIALAGCMKQDMPLHKLTRGTHGCYLACEGQLLFACEDIGRHNALDKVIGWAMRNGVDLTRCMVYVSGRVPTDMAVKVIRAHIPILISKEAPTVESLSLAREYQLTLIGMKKNGTMLLYNQPCNKEETP